MTTACIEFHPGDLEKFRIQFDVTAEVTADDVKELLEANGVEWDDLAPYHSGVTFDVIVNGTYAQMEEAGKKVVELIEKKYPRAGVDTLQRGFVCDWVAL
jgi:shikimate 5-dehydrogenase